MQMGPLEVECLRSLGEIQNISHRITSSASLYLNGQNISTFQGLSHRLQTINTSCNTISRAISNTGTSTLDRRTLNWLCRGGPYRCVDKLNEVDDMLQRSVPLIPDEDKITAAMDLLTQHENHFHSLLNTEDGEGSHDQPSEAPQANALPAAGEIRFPEAAHVPSLTSVPLSSTKRPMTVERRNALKQRLDEVSRWLDAWDCTEKHNNTHKLCREGTCKWFTNTVTFKNWWILRNQFLWLHGKAGCGKSVLTAWTIEHLKKNLRDGEVLVFFYCDFRNKRSTSPTEVIRSLLSQLLGQVLDRGRDPEDLPNAIIERKSQGALPLDDLDELYRVISDVVLCFRYEPIIVIDSLDECMDMERLLDVLVRLCRVRVLVTSRPDPSILNRLGPLPSLSFEDVHNELALDIALHITRELDSDNQLRSAGPEVKDQLRAELITKADGRFRWVQCHLDILKRCATTRELRAALGNLPTELDVTYGKILAEIDERKSELARRALAWLAVASEPVQLSLIVAGLSFDLEEGKIGGDVGRLRCDLLAGLSILVTHSETTDILEMSHFSVKEYLVSAVALPQYRIIPQDAHAEVVRLCTSFVSDFLKRTRSNGNITSLEYSPVFPYALSPGFKHLAHVDSGSPVVLEALRSLEFDIQCHPSYWDRLCELREEKIRWPYLPWPSSRHDVIIYILIAYSTAEVVKSFLSLRRPPKPRIGTNPLVYAADLRKTEHANTLLGCGADLDVNVPGLVIDDSYKASPLEAAIDIGDSALVGELLNRRVTVTPELLSTAVCMPWCSTGVLVKLVQTDEFASWARNIGDEKLYRNMFNSARPNAGDRRKADADHVALARRLRELGQDLSPNNPFWKELVRRALHAAHTSMLDFLLPPHEPPPAKFLLTACTGDTPETVSVVRFLLSKGIDIHAVSGVRRDTAFHLAAMCPWERRSLELTELLISAGCNPDARNAHGETPLSIATQRGYATVLEYMFSHSVSSPRAILSYALQQRATPQMIKNLISRGADIHFMTPNGDTLLHLVASHYPESECLELFESFVEAGCSLTTSNSQGSTPLELVANRHRYTSVVEWLLRQNRPLPPAALFIALQQQIDSEMVRVLLHKVTDVQSTTPDGDTVVHIALRCYWESYCLELLKILAEAGCSITVPDSRGKTPLEVAIRRGYTPVVKWLLSQNVPLDPAALLFALQGRTDTEMVRVLLHKGANVHYATSDGDTVVHLAIRGYWEPYCLDLLKIFADAGCRLATTNSHGETPLETAIQERYTLVVEWLLSLNVPPPSAALSIALQQQADAEMIRLLIYRGADMQSTTSDGDTVAHLAIAGYDELDCLHLLKIFAEAGSSLQATTNFIGRTPVEVAVRRGYALVVGWLLSQDNPRPPAPLLFALELRAGLEIIRVLVDKGADLQSTTSDGDTAVHLAISGYDKSDCLHLLKIFAEAGCSLITPNSHGETPLDAAIRGGHILVVEWLLSPNIPPPLTVLSTALQRQASTEMVRLLMHQGADVQCTTPDKDTVVHLAITAYNESDCLHLLKLFAAAGCDLATTNSVGRTPLEIAIRHGYTSVVGWLLSQNDPHPPAPLLYALRLRAGPKMVQILVDKGADLQSTTPNGDTVVHLAISGYWESYTLDLLKNFTKAGCSLTTTNTTGSTPLELAIWRGYTSVVEWILSQDVPLDSCALLFALQGRTDTKMVRVLVDKGAYPHCVTSDGDTVAHLSIRGYWETYCLDLLKIFAEAGCSLTTTNSTGNTPLELAIQRGYTSVVKWLLLQNVPLSPTVILVALQTRTDTRTVQVLVDKCSDPQSTTSDGDTMAHLAVAEYHESDCLHLLEIFAGAGCSLTTTNSKGTTPLDAAMQKGYGLVVDRLVAITECPASPSRPAAT